MKRYERKIKKIVFENLDGIYKTAYSIAKDWDKNTIPISTLEVIINKSRPNINTGEKSIDTFNINYGNLLDSLLNTCKKVSEKMDSNSIPISQLKNGINILKKGFANGLSSNS